MPLTALTLSFECDQSSRESMSVVGSSDTPIIYQANETAIRASLFNGDPSSTTFVSDISNVVSARLVIRKNHSRGTVLVDKVATLDGTTTYSTWVAGTKQQLLFSLTEVETNQAVPSDGSLEIYAAIEIVTTTGPIVVGFFNGVIQYDGITDVDDPILPELGAEDVNTVYAGPSTGMPDLPNFRALVSADIPILAESKILNLVSDLSLANTVFVDATNGSVSGVRGTFRAFATVAQAVAAASAGDTIIVRPGNYSWSTQTISLANISIFAHGATFTKTTLTGVNFLTVTGAGFKIRGATFDGNRGSNATGFFTNFLITGPSSNAVIENCRFINNSGHAIGGTGSYDNVRIIGCYFSNNLGDIWLKDFTNATIFNNTFAGNVNSNTYSGAVKIDGTSAYIARHIISGNNIHGPGEMGIEIFEHAARCEVSNNVVHGTTFGISNGFTTGTIISNNTIKGTTFCGIEVAGSTNTLCSGNKIDGTNDAGTRVLTNGYSLSASSDMTSIQGGEVLDATVAFNAFNVTKTTVNGVTIRCGLSNNSSCIAQNSDISVTNCKIYSSGSADAFQYFNSGSSALTGPMFIGNTLVGNFSTRIVALVNTGGGSILNSIVANNVSNSTAPSSGFLATSGTVTGTKIYGNTQNDATNATGFANSYLVGDGSNITGIAVLSVANTFTAIQTLPVQDKGGQVFNAAAYSGANLGAKIQAAHDAMPSNGGIIEAGVVSLAGSQTLSAITLTKPVIIRFGYQNITASGSITIASGAGSVQIEGVGLGENKGTTITTPNGASLIVFDSPGTSYQNTLTIRGCCFKAGTGVTNIVKSLSPINSGLLQSHFVFQDNNVRDFTNSYALDLGTTFYYNFVDRNFFHDNTYSISAGENSDIQISNNTGTGKFGQITVYPSNTRIIHNTFVPAGTTNPDILVDTVTDGGDNGLLISGNSFTPEGEIVGRAKIKFHSSTNTSFVIKDVRIVNNKLLSAASAWGQTAIQVDNPVNNLAIRGNHFDGFQYVVGDEQLALVAGGVFEGNTIVTQQNASIASTSSTAFKNGGRGFDLISFSSPTSIEGVSNEPRSNEKFYLINRLSDSDAFDGINWSKSTGVTVATAQTDPLGGSTACLITRDGAAINQSINAAVSTGAIGGSPVMGSRVVVTFWAKSNSTISADIGLIDSITGNFPSGLRRVTLSTAWKKYKLTVSGINASDAHSVYVYPVQANTATAGSLYLWHFQVADADSDFLPTTGAAASDLIHGNRYERGLLIGGDFGFSTSRFFDLTNAVALRNGANPQSFYVSNLYIDASNYERGAIQWSGNVLTIGTQKAGTGSNRGLVLNGDNGVTLTAGGQSWSINTSGTWFPNTDAARDIGLSGTNRPRDLFLSRNAVIGGAATLGTPLAVTSGGNGLATATLGGIRYASAANTLLELAGNTTSTINFLSQTGTGSVSTAPAWRTPTQIRSDLSLVASATTDTTNASNISSGRLPNARNTLGAQLYDNVPILAADFNSRVLFGGDGVTHAVDWGGPYIYDVEGTLVADFSSPGETSFPLDLSVGGQLTCLGNLVLADGKNIAATSITGTKIGTATTQKLGFFNATPVVQQTGNVVNALSNLGLVTSATWPTASLTGTATNDNAATGRIGEYISASIVQASAVTLVTATPKTVTSISLSAGDWDVTAIGALTGASTGTEFDVAVGTTTDSLTGTVLGDTRCQTPTVSLAGADASLMIPAVRVSISATTTYYLVVQETFTVGSPKAYGRISARRVR